jgi:hypothetical protein
VWHSHTIFVAHHKAKDKYMAGFFVQEKALANMQTILIVLLIGTLSFILFSIGIEAITQLKEKYGKRIKHFFLPHKY